MGILHGGRILLLLSFLSAPGLWLAAQSCGDWPQPARKLSLDLDGGSLSGRLRITGVGGSSFGMRFIAVDEGLDIRGALDIVGTDGGVTALAGPGEACGALRLAANPASLSSGLLHPGCVELDSSLDSGTAVLGLDLGAWSLFALERGMGAGILLPRTGSIASGALGGGSSPSAPTAKEGVAGVGFSLPCAGGRFRGTASLSRRAGRTGGDGWCPDPRPDPPGSVANAALLREFVWASGNAVAGCVGSMGRLEGPGMGARLEVQQRLGGLGLRIAAGAAGAGYRDLYGSAPLHDVGLAADVRLALRGAARADLSLRMQGDPPESGGTARAASLPWSPRLSARSAALSLTAPSGTDGHSARLSLTGERDGGKAGGPEGEMPPRLGIALALFESQGGAGGLWSSCWSGELALGPEGRSGLEGVSIGVTAAHGPPASIPGPRIEFELDLRLLEGGRKDAPGLARFGLALWLPFRSASRLGVTADFPETPLGLIDDALPAAGRATTMKGPELTLSLRLAP